MHKREVRLPYEFARYLKVRAAYGATWSPDGCRIAFLTDITGVPQAWEVPIGGGWPEQLTFHEERISGIHYSPTENRLLFSMDAGGGRPFPLTRPPLLEPQQRPVQALPRERRGDSTDPARGRRALLRGAGD